ncbi:unnamed protein product [Cylindrotheca closterium]|uniref:Uncharacterized protein n=1 Tax=Cylindrotheca closterium TaxID=2856 RepID=A0AAD2CGU9_9STRA|nr:unnamed protein product [Cylindrotheca closterium]
MAAKKAEASLKSLHAELDKDVPSAKACLAFLGEAGEVLKDLDHETLEELNVMKTLGKMTRSVKRHKRSSEEAEDWESALKVVNKLQLQCKTSSKVDSKAKQEISKPSSQPGNHSTVKEYRARLVVQKKDMYKDPPVLPPLDIKIETSFCRPPKRNKETGMLSFVATTSEVSNLLKDFHPNRTPEEVLRAGSFGGTYFRPISSAVTNVSYSANDVLEDSVEKDWIKGLPMNMLTSKTYRPEINKYGVKCGGSLGMWESSGWITPVDPYGWFQWYCRFYRGRRCDDDVRQISRWLKSAGPKGRFRSQLCNKIIAAQADHNDNSISPVIRQTLLHWGLEITPDVLTKHAKRVGK